MGAGEEVVCGLVTNPGNVSGNSRPGGADSPRELRPAPINLLTGEQRD